MRIALLSTALLACASCTVISGKGSSGSYTYATLGGDVSGYTQSASGITAESVTTSSSFRELNKSARFGLGAAAVASVAKDLSSAWSSSGASGDALSASQSANQAATAQAKIAADLEKARLLAPVETIPLP